VIQTCHSSDEAEAVSGDSGAIVTSQNPKTDTYAGLTHLISGPIHVQNGKAEMKPREPAQEGERSFQNI